MSRLDFVDQSDGAAPPLATSGWRRIRLRLRDPEGPAPAAHHAMKRRVSDLTAKGPSLRKRGRQTSPGSRREGRLETASGRSLGLWKDGNAIYQTAFSQKRGKCVRGPSQDLAHFKSREQKKQGQARIGRRKARRVRACARVCMSVCMDARVCTCARKLEWGRMYQGACASHHFERKCLFLVRATLRKRLKLN